MTVGQVGSTGADVTQTIKYVDDNNKLGHLMKFLLMIEDEMIFIFVETKRSYNFIKDVLCERGFPACSIHGDKG